MLSDFEKEDEVIVNLKKKVTRVLIQINLISRKNGEVNIEGMETRQVEQVLADDIRHQLQNNISKDLIENLSSRLKNVMLRMQRSNSIHRKNSSINIQKLLRGRTREESPTEIKTRQESWSKIKKGGLGPAEILMRILQDASGREEDSRLAKKSEQTKSFSGPKINAFKTYEFGSGKIKEYNRSNFLFALEAFEAIYESVIKHDLEVNSKERKFDYNSLMNLIRFYLEKILQQFKGWTDSDQKAVNEIITRTEQTFFAGRLHKQFLSDKTKYMQMNVFKRLNEIEVISLKKLFKQIKYLLLNKKENYSLSVNDAPKKYYELRMPPAVLVEANIEEYIQKEEAKNDLPLRKLPKEEMKIERTGQEKKKNFQIKNTSMLMKKPAKITAKVFDELRDMNFKKENMMKKEEMDHLESLDYVDKILHKYIQKALFYFLKIDLQLIDLENKAPPQVKNYEINLIELDEELDIQDSSIHSESASRASQVPIIKNRDFVFEVLDFRKEIEKKRLEMMGNTTRRFYGNKLPISSLSKYGKSIEDTDKKMTNPKVETSRRFGHARKRRENINRLKSKDTSRKLPAIKTTVFKQKKSKSVASSSIKTSTHLMTKNDMIIVGDSTEPGNSSSINRLESPIPGIRSRIKYNDGIKDEFPQQESNPNVVRQKNLGKSLSLHFVKNNQHLLDYLHRSLKARLSASCTQGIASQNP